MSRIMVQAATSAFEQVLMQAAFSALEVLTQAACSALRNNT